MESSNYVAPPPGPAAFACAYLNGRADAVPPLLLALEGLTDVATLLTAARGAHILGRGPGYIVVRKTAPCVVPKALDALRGWAL